MDDSRDTWSSITIEHCGGADSQDDREKVQSQTYSSGLISCSVEVLSIGCLIQHHLSVVKNANFDFVSSLAGSPPQLGVTFKLSWLLGRYLISSVFDL